MDRTIWTQQLTKEECPPWPCHICKKGTLALVKDSLTYHETIDSTRAHGCEDWYPDWISYSFTAWAQCTHPACKQQFAISGDGGVGMEPVDEHNWEWADFFSPKSCYPMPDIIDLPNKIPTDVLNELRASFSLFWVNRESCAGRIRVALELLMDHLGVPKKGKSKSGKPFELKLHDRIDVYATNEPTIGYQLMALKWLGNTGSHSGSLNEDDLLDAFEILEHSLGEILDRRSARVADLAITLTRKHAPRKP